MVLVVLTVHEVAVEWPVVFSASAVEMLFFMFFCIYSEALSLGGTVTSLKGQSIALLS